MQAFRPRAVFLLAAGVMLAASLPATIVKKMELSELCERADKIFRGTVLSAQEGSVQAGGGELPTVTYYIEVDESFQGEFRTKGDRHIAEITMLANSKTRNVDGARSFPLIRDLPQLEVGRTYLLMTSPPSRLGLSAPIGLGQGCFTISGKGDAQVATDGFGNSYNYADLASDIQAAVAQ